MKKSKIFNAIFFILFIYNINTIAVLDKPDILNNYTTDVQDIKTNKISGGFVQYSLSKKDITVTLITKNSELHNLHTYIWPDKENDILGDNIKILSSKEKDSQVKEMEENLIRYVISQKKIIKTKDSHQNVTY